MKREANGNRKGMERELERNNRRAKKSPRPGGRGEKTVGVRDGYSSSGPTIASTGHTSAQAPHSVQSSASIT